MPKRNARRRRTAKEKAEAVLEVSTRLNVREWKVLEACEEVGIHPSQYYRWKKLADAEEAGDQNAWKPKSKRPKKLARQTPDFVRDKIVSLASSARFRSANGIAQAVRNELGNRIHTATVIKILEEEGLYGVIEERAEDGRLLRKKKGLKVQIDV